MLVAETSADVDSFSHYRVAPPPASWIHTAHRHGVPILGTLIFEHKESEPDVTLLVHPENADLRHYAVHLAELAVERGFDGWLLNIEVSLPGGKEHAQRVVEWTCLLREELRNRVGPHAQVVWFVWQFLDTPFMLKYSVGTIASLTVASLLGKTAYVWPTTSIFVPQARFSPTIPGRRTTHCSALSIFA